MPTHKKHVPGGHHQISDLFVHHASAQGDAFIVPSISQATSFMTKSWLCTNGNIGFTVREPVSRSPYWKRTNWPSHSSRNITSEIRSLRLRGTRVASLLVWDLWVGSLLVWDFWTATLWFAICTNAALRAHFFTLQALVLPWCLLRACPMPHLAWKIPRIASQSVVPIASRPIAH